MVNIVVGDLLKAKENIIVHQVNCQGVMGSGIALQIKNKFPVVYDRYIEKASLSKNDKERLLGQVQFVETKDYLVANLFGQLTYGREKKKYTNYEAIYNGLLLIKRVAKGNELSVAIPYKIGCDRGGADWDIVYMMIEKIFEDYSITIYKLEEF